jgi:sporulation protein YlmC with PRC-barrel domain
LVATANVDKEVRMQLYGIRRRSWWKTPEELEAAALRSKEVGDEDGSGVRWIRSYVVQEDDGTLGTYCIYEAESPDALRRHAENSGFGADEINAVADTVIIRPDPVSEPAAT